MATKKGVNKSVVEKPVKAKKATKVVNKPTSVKKRKSSSENRKWQPPKKNAKY